MVSFRKHDFKENIATMIINEPIISISLCVIQMEDTRSELEEM